MSLVPCLLGVKRPKVSECWPRRSQKNFPKKQLLHGSWIWLPFTWLQLGDDWREDISDDGPKTILQTLFPALFQLSPASNFASLCCRSPFVSSCTSPKVPVRDILQCKPTWSRWTKIARRLCFESWTWNNIRRNYGKFWNLHHGALKDMIDNLVPRRE
jgi:hypothetical protein